METTQTLPQVAEAGELRPLGRGASDAWHYQHDQEHTEIFFGGSAGPGKTFELCLFEIEQAIRFRGTAGALFRSSAEDLRKSTQVTFFEVAAKCRLRTGVDFIFNASKGIVKWAVGSVTYFDYLAYEQSDPNYSRLGGRAWSRAGIDEGDQVEERAVDMVASRLRYRLTEFCHSCAAVQMAARSVAVDCDDDGNPTMWECYNCGIWTKGLRPKLTITGNPGDYWTKYRFVYDKDGARVKLKPHQAVVLVLLDDNPDKAHVASYRRQLEQAFQDEYDRQRLLHGDWLITQRTGREFLHAFLSSTHASERIPYRPDLPLHISFDFNSHPYMTLLVAQIWQEEGGRNRLHFLQEICLGHPLSTTEATCAAFKRELEHGRYKGHASTIFYYGDRSGKDNNTLAQRGITHNYDIVERDLRKYLHNHSDRVIRRNPVHTIVRDFCNAYLAGRIEKLWVTFDPGMNNTIQDMIHTKENAEGGIHKHKVKDPATGISYEKYGHCLQAHYYLSVGAFPDLFQRFIRK